MAKKIFYVSHKWQNQGEVTVRNVPGGCRFDLILPKPGDREAEQSFA